MKGTGTSAYMCAAFPAKLRDTAGSRTFLYHPDPEGKPCILPMRDARLLFARFPEPTECAGALTMEQFHSLYRPYLEKEGLLEAPCLPEAMLRLQEAACYDW